MEGCVDFPHRTSPSTTGSNVGRTPRHSLADLVTPSPATPRSINRPLMPTPPPGILSLKVYEYAVILGCVILGCIFVALALFHNAHCYSIIKFITIFFITIGMFVSLMAIVAILSYLVFLPEHLPAVVRTPQTAGYSNNNRPAECPYFKPLGTKCTIPPEGLYKQAIQDDCEVNWDCSKNIVNNEIDDSEDEEEWFSRQTKTVPLIPSNFSAVQAEKMRMSALRKRTSVISAPVRVSPVDHNGRRASPVRQNATSCTRETQRPLRELTRTRRNSNSPEAQGRNMHSCNNSNPEGSQRVGPPPGPQPGCYAPPREFAFFRTDDCDC